MTTVTFKAAVTKKLIDQTKDWWFWLTLVCENRWTLDYDKCGLISESFFTSVQISQKRCQITFLRNRHLKRKYYLLSRVVWHLFERFEPKWKTFEIKPPLKRNKETFLEDSVLILRCFFASSKETRSLHVTHCYFTQLNPKRISPFKQKEFLKSTEGFLRAKLTGHSHPSPVWKIAKMTLFNPCM